MTNQVPDRPRIHSIITKSRFLHIEDALTPQAPGKAGKVRFFIGAYQRGSGQPAEVAHHFLDDAAARVLFADLQWGKFVDITDYKGSVNGTKPVSRVLKVKGPMENTGKVWFQISMGPGEVIGQGAVKPKGKAEVEISIGLTVAQARQLALAAIEYMTAFRVAHMISAHAIVPKANGPLPPTARIVDTKTGEILKPKANPIQDLDDLFGTEQAAATEDPPAASPQKEARCEVCGQKLPHHAPGCRIIIGRNADAAEAERKAQEEDRELADHIGDEVGPEEPPADTAPAFFSLVNKALARGVLDLAGVQQRIKAPGSWRDKGLELQAMLAS